MKLLHKCTYSLFTVGAFLLLAVILITGCGDVATQVAASPPTTIPSTTTVKPPATSSPTSPSPSATATAIRSLPTPTKTAQPTHTLTSVPPTRTSTPNPTPTARKTATLVPVVGSGPVQVYQTTVTLPTYPFKEYLIEQVDPVYNMPVYYFNRPKYELDPPTPTPVDYNGVVLENPYLQLTFLPELGGRLYSAKIKATDQEIFYQNPVVKPSRYGVLQPYEANWWLATGGLEWAYPTQEHGYRFGVPWEYTITQNTSGATITLSDNAANRAGLEVNVTLPAESAAFEVAPLLTNNGAKTVPVQLWTNAALALSSGSMSPDTQFVVPTEVITVHSRGQDGWTVPDAHEQAPWPQIDQTDLRDYNQWANYLGFFVPNQEVPFVGAYNPALKLGVVRLADPGTTSGSGKLFAFGSSFPDRSYTDDESQYFEIWGGANTGFWPEDDINVSPDKSLGWRETWWPLAGLQGLTWATVDVAIAVEQDNDEIMLSALVAEPTNGYVQALVQNSIVFSNTFSANPTAPLLWQFEAAGRPVIIEVKDNNDVLLLEYQLN